ncbi:MAG: hypothetical protein EON59_01740 [Alphaproteobacteria bacterium]|nr:MAG: hypothetical protein EON59_01740 [Alphaproteobacteria bacterium]
MPKPPKTTIAKFYRVTTLEGQTTHFTTADGGRTGRSPLQFFDIAQVPPFEGSSAWFECELVRNGARIVKVLHEVDPPAGRA